MTGMMKPKTSSATKDAERRAADAEAKARKDEEMALADEEYRRKNQRGKISTVLTKPAMTEGGASRSLLGG